MVPRTFKAEKSFVLGLGINGKVVECTNKASGGKYALKVLKDNAGDTQPAFL